MHVFEINGKYWVRVYAQNVHMLQFIYKCDLKYKLSKVAMELNIVKFCKIETRSSIDQNHLHVIKDVISIIMHPSSHKV